ncbi:MAG: twitching motility protein PilT [Myxococcota bacterium]|jgi:twitching motility protein PilT
MARMDNFLHLMNDRGASDIHFCVGQPPTLRLSGVVEPVRYKQLSQTDFDVFMGEITPKHLWESFKKKGDQDYAYECEGLARFRVNLFRQEHGDGAVMRIIPTKLFTMDQLGLPDTCRFICELERGLVLVTGPTGSGKSTTLSAIINKMNETRSLHIITIEDPVEFVHPPKMSIITQREVHAHTHSFASGLKAALREDPDVVLVGEMRDQETIALALSAAETGLLVFGTLHTNSAAKTVDRIINVFPTDEQDGVRSIIGDSLTCVLAQQLLRRSAGGRVAALEILFGSPALGNIVREGKTHQITNLIRQGKRQGMVTMDDSLVQLVKDEVVTPEAAYEKAIDKKDFRKFMAVLGHIVGASDESPEEMEKMLMDAIGAM